MKYLGAVRSPKAACYYCNAPIYWVERPNGRMQARELAPDGDIGPPHDRRTCPVLATFRRGSFAP